jgi:hypothetical protein
MAYRRPSRKSSSKSFGSKFHEAKILPQWTPAHANSANFAFQMVMQKFGITDAKTYFHKLRIPIVISVIVCACIGASQSGLGGFIAGTLVGLIAPVAVKRSKVDTFVT